MALSKNQLYQRLLTGEAKVPEPPKKRVRRKSPQSNFDTPQLLKSDKQASNGVLLSTKQLERMFNVSAMTIWNWRNKTKDSLPALRLSGGELKAVRFDEGVVISWANRNHKVVANWDYLDR